MEKLKVFFGGFFSNTCAEKAEKGGFLPFMINLILSVVVIFFGTLAVDILSFYPKYDGATYLKKTVENLIDKSVSGVSLTVGEDGLLRATADGETVFGAAIDTFLSEDDKIAYSVGGFDLVVDTRDAMAYDDFEAYCVSLSDGSVISYEDYLGFAESQKSNYEFKIRYTLREVDLSDEKTADRENFLIGKGGSAAEESAELKRKLSSGEIDEVGYKNGVWVLFVKNYYPDLSQWEKTSSAPLVRNYYYHNYALEGKTDYLFVFSDSLVCSYRTADGKTERFYGFYDKLPVGTVTDGDEFVKTAFLSSVRLSEYVYLMNVMRFLPLYVIMPLVAVIISFLVIRIGERERARKFSDVLKIVSTFIFWSAVVAAIVTFGLTLVFGRDLIFTIISVCYFCVLMIRSIVWFAADIAKRKAETGVCPTDR